MLNVPKNKELLVHFLEGDVSFNQMVETMNYPNYVSKATPRTNTRRRAFFNSVKMPSLSNIRFEEDKEERKKEENLKPTE